MTYLFVFCIVLYHIAEGITEAMTWLGRTQDIAPGIYHRYRLMEGIGIVGAMVGAYGIARSPVRFGMLLVGAWLIGWAAYEAAYTMKVKCGLWKKPYPWRVRGFGKEISIRFPRWIYPVALCAGAALICV